MRSLALAATAALAVTACSPGYAGSARATSWPPRSGSWLAASGVPDVRQRRARDCGAAALAAVLQFWGRDADPVQIDRALRPDADGAIAAGALRDHALATGLYAFLIRGTFDDLRRELARGRPVLVGTVKRYGREHRTHYEVVVGVEPDRQRVVTLDPAHGWRINSFDGFRSEWQRSGRVTIVAFPK